MKKIIYLAALCVLPGLAFAVPRSISGKQKTGGPNLDTIAFQYVNNMIVVKVAINGKNRNFFFDTGAPTLISKDLQNELGIPLTESKKVTDAALNTTQMRSALVPLMKVGSLELSNVPVTVFDMQTIEQLGCMNIQGFLGVDIFKQSTLQIDLPNRRLIISDKPALLCPDKRFENKLTLLNAQKSPMVSVKFGKVFIENALFDTGMSSGLYSVSDQTYNYVNKSTDLNSYIVARGYGASVKVATGTEAESEKIKLKFDDLTIGEVTIRNPVIGRGKQPHSLLGVEVLNYGKATFDFVNEKFYFEPVDRPNNDAPIVKTAGFELKLEKNIFSAGVVWKNSVAEKKGLKPGYKIIQYGIRNVENLSPQEVCGVLTESPANNGTVKEKKELKLTFVDDRGKKRTLVLPFVDISSLK